MKNSRRDFLKYLLSTSTLLSGLPVLKLDDLFRKNEIQADIAVVVGNDPSAATEKAIELIGGIKRFISRGDKVVIKPNIGWKRTPAQAATTNPFVVGTVVKLCFEAGAASVTVTGVPVHPAAATFSKSGIAAAVEKNGGRILLPSSSLAATMNVKGIRLKNVPIYKPLIEADKLINIPIAKHHALTRLTLGMKNWFGGIVGSRGKYHNKIHVNIADLAAFFKPQLTIIDAYRILLRNGPIGGNLADVALKKTIIASTDPVAADTYAASLFNLKPKDVPHILLGEKRKLGVTDLSKLRLIKVKLA